MPRTLIAIPVYNEEKYVARVIAHVLEYADNILVIDDGSTDHTPDLLTHFPVDVIRHCTNRGYGRSMRDAFAWAAARNFDWVITMDCDEQHEPASIPAFRKRILADQSDIISGSRYLNLEQSTSSPLSPPADRRAINQQITAEINQTLGHALRTPLTDSFCGFKAHRTRAVADLPLSQDGYAFPMQFWVQAAAMRLRIEELPVKLIYNDPNRSFGSHLDNPAQRLAHYRSVLHDEIQRWTDELAPAAPSTPDNHPSCKCSRSCL